jgi:mono/diheme cytochrome c family protein
MTLVAGAATVALLALSGCAPDVNAAIISPSLGAALEAEEAGQVLVIEPTPIPPVLADLTPEEITAGLPEDLAQALAVADPTQGPVLATSKGCIGCHSLDPEAVMTGPTWHNVGDHAIIRVATESPAEYIHQSIVNTNDFVVPGYPANIMPANYGEQLSTQELANIIAYLLQQTGQP